MALQDTRDTLQQREEEKRTALQNYEREKKAIESGADISSEYYDRATGQWAETTEGAKAKQDYEAESAAKLEALRIAIAATTEQANMLSEAVANATQSLSHITGAEAFNALGRSIDEAKEKLLQLTQGVSSDPAFNKILTVGDTIDAAKSAAAKLRDESGFYKDGVWDTSTVKGMKALQAYNRVNAKIENMEAEAPVLYGSVFEQMDRE